VVLVVVLGVGTGLYLLGGGRLAAQTGRTSLSGARGDELHTFLRLGTGGDTVELVSAHAVGLDPELEAEVRLVRLVGGSPIGSSVGPLGDGYEIVKLAGSRIRSSPPGDVPYWLDLRLVTSGLGEHCLHGVDVTYRAGFLRTRTARLATEVCVSTIG
jgi:hypothetical protein